MTDTDIEKLAEGHDEAARVWRKVPAMRHYHETEAAKLRAHLTTPNGDKE